MPVNLIPPPIYGAVTFIVMWLLHTRYPLTSTSAEWPVLVGWIIVVLGLALDLISLFNFRKAKTTVNPMRPENTSELITTGLYTITRNPMYLGMAIMLTGVALILRSLSPLIMPLIFCLVVTLVQILPEEKALEELFGEEYRNYKHRVARWI